MNLSDENKKNLMMFGIIGVVVFGLLFLGMPKVIDKLSDKVIEKLNADYTPGPYAPGIDPDKINPDALSGKAPATNNNNQWQLN